MTKEFSLPLSITDIKSYLPHRDPMLFIHRVLSVSETHIIAESDISPDAPFFKGHFPDLPIMPGVLIIETVAQAGALLVSLTKGLDEDNFIAFSSVESAKFKKPVYPGDIMTLEVEIERIRLPFYKFVGTAKVNETVVATLKFAATQMNYDKG